VTPEAFRDTAKTKINNSKPKPVTKDHRQSSPPIGRAVVPVGSEGWLRLLGEGGIEDLDHLLS
jgi:hypothetical protein